ncbi:hypothetical protein PTMSG1_10106 [Pyrenophora teres f. maculata]|nr:hypothetical protein PTMSG1_10106 [Pyrenophora teres f. maculata]
MKHCLPPLHNDPYALAYRYREYMSRYPTRFLQYSNPYYEKLLANFPEPDPDATDDRSRAIRYAKEHYESFYEIGGSGKTIEGPGALVPLGTLGTLGTSVVLVYIVVVALPTGAGVETTGAGVVDVTTITMLLLDCITEDDDKGVDEEAAGVDETGVEEAGAEDDKIGPQTLF